MVDYNNQSPPPLIGDITFDHTGVGFAVWYSDSLAREYEYLIDQSAEWLRAQPGIKQVIHDDLVVLMVEGRLDSALMHDLRVWWSQKVEGLVLG